MIENVQLIYTCDFMVILMNRFSLGRVEPMDDIKLY